MAGSALLSARNVQELLDVDVSTIYRMAADGRLPAVRVGRQWRFPADAIEQLLTAADVPATERVSRAVPPTLATELLEIVAEPLGVMMVVTDLGGRPITPVVNPCPWFADRADDPEVVEVCAAEWRDLAEEIHLVPRLRASALGFLCARSLVRSGNELVGMVLAGGVAPEGEDAPGLYHLDDAGRGQVLETLPKVAAYLSRLTSRPPGTQALRADPRGS